MKHILGLILITLYGAGSDVLWSLKCAKIGRAGENTRVRTGDRLTLSQTPRQGSNPGRSGDAILNNYDNTENLGLRK